MNKQHCSRMVALAFITTCAVSLDIRAAGLSPAAVRVCGQTPRALSTLHATVDLAARQAPQLPQWVRRILAEPIDRKSVYDLVQGLVEKPTALGSPHWDISDGDLRILRYVHALPASAFDAAGDPVHPRRVLGRILSRIERTRAIPFSARTIPGVRLTLGNPTPNTLENPERGEKWLRILRVSVDDALTTRHGGTVGFSWNGERASIRVAPGAHKEDVALQLGEAAIARGIANPENVIRDISDGRQPHKGTTLIELLP